MPQVTPCEECRKMIRPEDEYVSVGTSTRPPAHELKVHAACWDAYDKKKKERKPSPAG